MKVLIVLFSVIVVNGFGQYRFNGHDRLTKEEFAEIKKSRWKFVPIDLKNDTVVVVRYSVARLEQLQATARNTEFARNGEDTTGYTDEFLFGKKQVEHGRHLLEKYSTEFPREQSEKLSKKGFKTLIVEETDLKSNQQYGNKYWLTTVYVCSQERFKGGWISTMENQFFDPRTEDYYQIFSSLNHTLFELLD